MPPEAIEAAEWQGEVTQQGSGQAGSETPFSYISLFLTCWATLHAVFWGSVQAYRAQLSSH